MPTDAVKPFVRLTAEEKVDLYTYEIVKTKKNIEQVSASLESEDKVTAENAKREVGRLQARLDKLTKFKDKYLNSDSVDAEIERLEEKLAVYTDRVSILNDKIADLKAWKLNL